MAAARDQRGGGGRGGENKTDRSIMDRITPRRRGKKGTNFVFPFSSLPPPDLGLGSNFLKKEKEIVLERMRHPLLSSPPENLVEIASDRTLAQSACPRSHFSAVF